MRIGADPDELARVAAQGPGQAFALEHVAASLERSNERYRSRAVTTDVDLAPDAAAVRALARRLVRLDAWLARVAAALRDADTPTLLTALLALGPDVTSQGGWPIDAGPRRDLLTRWSDDDLASAARIPQLPRTWRDPLHRERVRRWARAATAPPHHQHGDPPTPGGLAAWFDRAVVDRLSPLTDLHVTPAETAARRAAAVAGARGLLAHPDLTVWSFTDGDEPTIRVALGDPGAATHLIVLLPGTSTGLHAADASLADTVALHDLASRLAPAGAQVATVLDLYAAPADLGRAVDPVPARTAGAATAAFLADLPGAPRTTLVGHSYGALAAARASDEHPVDDLVLLGAPGVGVGGRDDLAGAQRVWAARAAGDPIALVADLDEALVALPQRWRPTTGPLADPLVAHGPDPTDPEFGALRLPTAPPPGGIAAPRVRGHLDYLRPGTASLTNVSLVAVGRGPVTRTAGTLRRARPPRRGRRARGADE